MNRNCLFNKAVALLLCAVLLIGYLPSIALPAAAATNDEWEGEPDVVETTTGPEGAQDNPIYLGDLENSVTVESGATVYYYGNFNGTTMTVTGTTGYNVIVGEEVSNDTDGTFTMSVVTNGPRDPFVFAIQNTTDAAVVYAVNFAYPEGSSMNPEIIGTDWDYTATLAAGNEEGYFYKYTATKAGILQVIVSSEGGWQYNVTNNATSAQGGADSTDGAKTHTYEMKVSVDNEIIINVNTFDPANWWNTPAGSVTVRVQYKPGTEPNPILLTDLSNTVTVPAGQTVYYHGNFSGMLMTVSGEGSYIYNGETTEIDGVAIPVDSGSFWGRDIVVAIVNDGETDAQYTINFVYPLGSKDNPATAVLGDNSATVAEGTDGYFFIYTAEKTGTLVMTMPSGNWQYTVNNLTTGVIGDLQDSSLDPVLNPYELKVTAGDEIQILVNTFNPEDVWTAPAGSVSFNLAYKAFARLATSDLSLDADIKLVTNFEIDSTLLNDEGAHFVVSKNGGLGVKERTIYMSDLIAQGANASGYYRIETDLAAAELTCEVTYTAYDGEGNVVLIKKGKNGTPSESLVYSGVEYAETVLKGTNEAKKAIIKAALVYGGYAQRYFSINTDNLAYDLLTKYGYEIPTLEDITLDTVNDNVVVSTGDLAVAKSLVPGLDSAIYLKVFFALKETSSIENITAVITKKGPDGLTYTETVTEFEYNESNGRYSVVLTDIPAALLDYEYKITFTDSVTGETGQIDASVLCWVRVALRGNNADNQMIAKAMYYYNQAANEFFGL